MVVSSVASVMYGAAVGIGTVGMVSQGNAPKETVLGAVAIIGMILIKEPMIVSRCSYVVRYQHISRLEPPVVTIMYVETRWSDRKLR